MVSCPAGGDWGGLMVSCPAGGDWGGLTLVWVGQAVSIHRHGTGMAEQQSDRFVIKRSRGFEGWQEQRERFLLQGQLSVLTSVSVMDVFVSYSSNKRWMCCY